MAPRVVLVTGAGGVGCGRAIARRFARKSAALIVADIDEPGGEETVRTIRNDGGRADFVRTDVRQRSQVEHLMEYAESTFGRLDVLVNNASAPHGTEEIDTWTETIETDLLGAMYTTQAAIEIMRRNSGGAIVNVASVSALWHGRRTPGGIAGYDVAKAGMIRMTTRLAPLAESAGIRVNCLAPGWIGTEEVRSYWESLSDAERLSRGVPARLLTTEQIADAVVRLAEDPSLAGRVLVWWSDDEPRLIEWGDRGYRYASTSWW